MKYKAGDKVRLRSDLEVGEYYGTMHYSHGMFAAHKPGDVVTIREIYDSSILNTYYVEGNSKPWWTDEMFSGLVIDAEPVSQQPQQGRKYKPGDRVKIREDLTKGNHGTCYACKEMVANAGKIVTVKAYVSDYTNQFYIVEKLRGCSSCWHWSEEMVESIDMELPQEITQDIVQEAPAPQLHTDWSWEDLF